MTAVEGSAFTKDILHFTANDAGAFTATIDWGDSTPVSAASITPLAGGGFAVNGSHTYAEDGSFTILVAIHDTADNTNAPGTSSATVTEGTLSQSSQPISVPEGTALTNVQVATFDDPGSPDPGTSFSSTINWGDGSTSTGTVTALTGPAGHYSITGSHTYAPDEATFNVTVTTSEINQPGSISSTNTATVTEADVLFGALANIFARTEGMAFSGTVATFSDTFTGNGPGDFTASINWGDGTTSAGTVTGGGSTFNVLGSHTYVEEGKFTASVTLADDTPGTATVTATGTVTVIDADIAASPVTIHGTEGAPLTNVDVATFTDENPLGTASDFVATVDWGDGATTAGTVVEDAAGTFHVQGSHTYTAAGQFGVRVSIVDNGNGRSVTDPSDSTDITVSTATIVISPLLPVASPVTATEGSAVAAGTLLGTFTDTGGADPLASYSATIDWGDGTPATAATVVASGANFQVVSATAHTYAEEGIFRTEISITDSDTVTETALASSTATVSDAALTAGTAVALTPNTGAVLPGTTVIGTFTDANTGAPASDFTAVIDWGDGSPTSLGTIVSTGAGAFSVEGGHTFTKPGTFATKINVLDDGGSTVSLTGSATVTDLVVTGSTRNFTATEGQSTGTFVLATFTDPNPLATVADVSAALAVGGWGDGTPTVAGIGLEVVQVGSTPAGSLFEVRGTHTYAEETAPGTPDPLSVVITTLGGGTTTLTSPPGGGVTVRDARLTSSNGTHITGTEGIATPATTLIGTFTDANQGATNADFLPTPGGNGGSVVVDWGDGTPLQTLAAANITASGSADGVVFSLTASHTFAEEGQFPITITVTDDGGATTIISSTAVISAGALTALAPGAQPTISTTEAALFPVPVFAPPVFKGPVGSFTDASPTATIDDFQTLIDWGDGTPLTAGTVSQPGGVGTPFVVSGSHTFADSGVNGGTGTSAIQVFVVDVDGARLTINNTASVADRPIVLTGSLNPASDSGQSHTDGITNVNQPNFVGTSEPFSHVSLFATPTAGGTATLIGQTQAGSDGFWSITSNRLADGSFTITATAVDQFGVTTTASPTQILPNASQGSLVIDTVGPRVANVFFNRANGEVDVVFQDDRSGMNLATLLDSANYFLARFHTPRRNLLVTNINVIPPASPTSPVDVAVVFNSGKLIRGGFFTFIIRDSTRGPSTVQDVAGNSLDGEFYGTFPSGNGIPGGDFVAMLDAFHRKVFAPQTVVGTANPANGGQGGPPVGAPHSGQFTPLVPRGGGSVFPARHHVRPAKVVIQHPHGPLHLRRG